MQLNCNIRSIQRFCCFFLVNYIHKTLFFFQFGFSWKVTICFVSYSRKLAINEAPIQAKFRSFLFSFFSNITQFFVWSIGPFRSLGTFLTLWGIFRVSGGSHPHQWGAQHTRLRENPSSLCLQWGETQHTPVENALGCRGGHPRLSGALRIVELWVWKSIFQQSSWIPVVKQ